MCQEQPLAGTQKCPWLPNTSLEHATLQPGPKNLAFKPVLMAPLRGFNPAPAVYGSEY
jgi:hypothetical protein